MTVRRMGIGARTGAVGSMNGERESFCVLELGELVRIPGEFRGCFVRRVFRWDGGMWIGLKVIRGL